MKRERKRELGRAWWVVLAMLAAAPLAQASPLLVAGMDEHILQIQEDGTLLRQLDWPAQPTWASGLVVLSDGDLLIGNLYANQIQRVDWTTGLLEGQFNVGRNPQHPSDMVVGRDGKLYVSAAGDDAILRYDLNTGAYIDAFVPTGSGGLADPMALSFGPDGNLYVISDWTAQILRYNGSTGAFMDVFAAYLPGIAYRGLAFGSDGYLYTGDFVFAKIMKYNTQTGASSVFVQGTFGDFMPNDLAFGPDGNLYVADASWDKVLRFNAQTGAPLGTFVENAPNAPSALLFTPEPASLSLLAVASVALLRRRRA